MKVQCFNTVIKVGFLGQVSAERPTGFLMIHASLASPANAKRDIQSKTCIGLRPIL